MPTVIDSFTGTDGQLLSTRPAGWTIFKVFPNNLPNVQANAARFSNNEGTFCGAGLEFGSADQDIEITLVNAPGASVGDNGCIYLRLSYTLNNGALSNFTTSALIIRAYGSNGIVVHDLVNGSETNPVGVTLASGTWAAGDKLRAKIAGTTLTLYRNSQQVQVITARTVNQTETKFGIGYPLVGGNWDIADVTDPGDTFGVSSTSILTSGLVQDRVYQRAAGSNLASMIFSGTYTGTPGAIEYRVFDVAANAALAGHDWQTLVASPAGGIFSATRNIASGGPYRLDVRGTAAPATVYAGTVQWLVGDIFLICGQSNADGLRNGTSAAIPHPQVRVYDQNDSWEVLVPSDGTGLVALADKIRALTGRPAGLIVRAASATSIGQWQPGGASLLEQALTDMQAATATPAKTGGDIAAFLWCQGEADTDAGSPYNAPSSYKSGLDAIYTAVKTKVSRIAAELPFLVAVTGRHDGQSGNDAGWQNIRTAQIDWCGATPGAVLSHMTYDLPMADAFHYAQPAGYEEHGRRFGRSAAKATGAAVYGSEGPKITTATRQGSVITISVALNGSSALQQGGTGPLSGWQVSSDGFSSILPIASATLQANNQIQLVLVSAPAVNDVVVLRYAYGQNPATTNIPVGDAA
jgi:hypothetical protein